MIEVNYYLRDKKANTTAIILFISYGGSRVKVGVVEQTNPKHWDFEMQRCKQIKSYQQGLIINELLSSIEQVCYSAFRDYLNANQQRLPEHTEFKYLIQSKLKPSTPSSLKQKEEELTFYEFIEKFIQESRTRFNDKSGKPISQVTIRNYGVTYSTLKAYGKHRKKPIQFHDIDLDFYSQFKDFLVHQLGYASNTVGKHIKTLKTFLNDATERGFNSNLKFRSKKFKVLTEEVERIYLNEDELRVLFELDLQHLKHLERVRDLFIIGCYTGLRFSDFRALTSDNFIKEQGREYIEILTQKTQQKVVIPVHRIVKGIRTRYAGKSATSLPKALCNKQMNLYLKKIGELAGFNQLEKVSITKGGEVQTQYLPKYHLITTHTARRSFATNMYLMGVPTLTIMAITGHKTEKAFMRYIKVTPKEHANELLKLWERSFNMI